LVSDSYDRCLAVAVINFVNNGERRRNDDFRTNEVRSPSRCLMSQVMLDVAYGAVHFVAVGSREPDFRQPLKRRRFPEDRVPHESSFQLAKVFEYLGRSKSSWFLACGFDFLNGELLPGPLVVLGGGFPQWRKEADEPPVGRPHFHLPALLVKLRCRCRIHNDGTHTFLSEALATLPTV
jgi:hypothetical protein